MNVFQDHIKKIKRREGDVAMSRGQREGDQAENLGGNTKATLPGRKTPIHETRHSPANRGAYNLSDYLFPTGLGLQQLKTSGCHCINVRVLRYSIR